MKILVLTTALFSIALLLACAGSQSSGSGGKWFTKPEETIEVSAGQEFTIALPSNRTTGYQWRLAGRLDETVVRLVRTAYEAPETKLPGAGGKEVWVFQAVGPGKTAIPLEYARSWEKGVPPAQKATFLIVVR